MHASIRDGEPLSTAVVGLLLGLKTVFLLRSFGYECEALVAPVTTYHRGIFQENVPLSLLSDYTSLRTLLDREDCPALCFSPKKIKGAQSDLLSRFSAVPMPHKYLVHDASFSQAFFGNDFRRVHQGGVGFTLSLIVTNMAFRDSRMTLTGGGGQGGPNKPADASLLQGPTP